MIYTYNAQCTGPRRRIRAPPTVDKRETREAEPAPAAGSRRQASMDVGASRSHTQMCDINFLFFCILYAIVGRDPAAHPIVNGKHFRRRLPVSHPPLPPEPNTRQRSRPLASSPAASVPRVRPATACALLRFPAPSGSRGRSGQGRLRIMNRGAPRRFVLSTVFKPPRRRASRSPCRIITALGRLRFLPRIGHGPRRDRLPAPCRERTERFCGFASKGIPLRITATWWTEPVAVTGFRPLVGIRRCPPSAASAHQGSQLSMHGPEKLQKRLQFVCIAFLQPERWAAGARWHSIGSRRAAHRQPRRNAALF